MFWRCNPVGLVASGAQASGFGESGYNSSVTDVLAGAGKKAGGSVDAFLEAGKVSKNPQVAAAVGVAKVIEGLAAMKQDLTAYHISCMDADGLQTYFEMKGVYHDGSNYSLKYGGIYNDTLVMEWIETAIKNPETDAN